MAKIINKNNSATILSFLSIAGLISTAVITAKVTPKALELIESDSREKHDGNPYSYTKREAIKSAWRCYIPVIVMGGTTAMCILGANILNKQHQASLAGAYAFIDNSYREYKTKLKELYGEEAHNKIINSIAKDHCEEVHIQSQGLLNNYTLDFNTSEPEVIRTFYDSFSHRYFESTINRVLQAEYHLNRNFCMGASVGINDFYNFLGLEEIREFDDFDWENYRYDIAWIDFMHRVTTLDDGMEILIIEYEFEPDVYFEE